MQMHWPHYNCSIFNSGTCQTGSSVGLQNTTTTKNLSPFDFTNTSTFFVNFKTHHVVKTKSVKETSMVSIKYNFEGQINFRLQKPFLASLKTVCCIGLYLSDITDLCKTGHCKA